MKRILSFLLILLSITMLTACSEKEPDNRIKMPASSSELKGSNYVEVIAQLESAGFTNIETTILDDLIVGWLTKDGEVEQVAVGGETSFYADSKHDANVKIIITYHTFPVKPSESEEETEEPISSTEEPSISLEEPTEVDITDEPSIPTETTASTTKEETSPPSTAPSVSFTRDIALRAAVVAFTNCYAVDVFTDDGNSFDTSKFHSYADLSGFYMHVNSLGSWKVIDEHTWHVDDLLLKVDGYNSNVFASLDVSFDGENYVVDNISGVGPSEDDLSAYNEGNYAFLFFVVPPEFVEEGRVTDNFDDLDDFDIDDIDLGDILSKSQAKDLFEMYGRAMYPHGFKCHWILDLRHSEQYNDGSWFFKVGVTIEDQNGNSEKYVAQGIVNALTYFVDDFNVN